MFSVSNSRDSVKAGSEEAYKQKEEWKKTPAFGLSYFSKYLTTATYGIRQKKFTVLSAPSGTGKSRLTVANLCYSFAPQYYDKKLGKFVDNPHGKNNAALYIGTEMELIEEVEPILWAYMADVPEDHIIMGQYEPGEEERVDEAIRILHDEGHIYLEYVPDYNVTLLENVIEEHVVQHGVRHVFFDYIMITTDLISEYQSMAQAKMTVREDQVLSNLSTKLKTLTAKYDISIDTWTQVSGDFKNEANRDQTIVRGSKAIIDKTDTAGIVMKITEKEKKLLAPILKTGEMFGTPEPNVSISLYKNRGGKYTNIKIWLLVDYSTMRVRDLFVTDYEYNIVKMPKTYIGINEDEKMIVTTSKEELNRLIKAREEAISIIDDGSSNALDDLVDKDVEETPETDSEEVKNVINTEVIEEDEQDFDDDDEEEDDGSVVEIDDSPIDIDLDESDSSSDDKVSDSEVAENNNTENNDNEDDETEDEEEIEDYEDDYLFDEDEAIPLDFDDEPEVKEEVQVKKSKKLQPVEDIDNTSDIEESQKEIVKEAPQKSTIHHLTDEEFDALFDF